MVLHIFSFAHDNLNSCGKFAWMTMNQRFYMVGIPTIFSKINFVFFAKGLLKGFVHCTGSFDNF